MKNAIRTLAVFMEAIFLNASFPWPNSARDLKCSKMSVFRFQKERVE